MQFKFDKSPEDPKITFEKNPPNPRFGGWRHVASIACNSRIAKVILYIVIPVIILNGWLFRWDDFSNGCHVKIHPSITEWNNLDIKKGIRWLKEKSFSDYQEMCDNVESISPELACGGMGGGCFSSRRPDQIVVSTVFRPKENHTETTAAFIAHEICHLLQYKEGRPIEEGECYDDYCRVLDIAGARDGYDVRCKDGEYLR